MRLRIATEVARTLLYLHSAASTPIYHRDIKTTNILLDNKYRTKVADFGTSRSIVVDQTHLTTVLLDIRTLSIFNQVSLQKSVMFIVLVFSFVELLTGEKAISSTRT